MEPTIPLHPNFCLYDEKYFKKDVQLSEVNPVPLSVTENPVIATLQYYQIAFFVIIFMSTSIFVAEASKELIIASNKG
jgi:hypothetical protein